MFLSLAGEAVAGENPSISIQTTAGTIVAELYPAAAPQTVANFLNYVDNGRFDNEATFYRTVRMDNQQQNNVKIEVIQGGLGMESGKLTFAPVAHESTQTSGILHRDGVISMARGEPGSATSEFFICINDQPALDYGGQRNPDGLGFAAFGRVVSGMPVVRRIHAMATDEAPGDDEGYTTGQILLEPVLIEKVSRVQTPR